jgi:hypothetical protein
MHSVVPFTVGVFIALTLAVFVAMFPGMVVLALSRPHPAVHGRESSVAILTPDEADAVARRVVALRDRWEAKSRGGVMFTLGSPSYIGGSKGFSNEEMIGEFGDTIDAVRAVFAARYPDHDVVVGGSDAAPGAGVPGFHIFNPCLASKLPVASLHIDKQYVNAGFPVERAASGYPGATLSFTLLVASPEGGAGLHLWSVSPYPEEKCALSAVANPYATIATLLRNSDAHTYVDYSIGRLEIHSGNRFHLIAPFARGDTLQRITLQGHGFFVDGLRPKLCLYW